MARMYRTAWIPALLLLTYAGLCACADERVRGASRPLADSSIAPPLVLADDGAYGAANRTTLAERTPDEVGALHNVYRLSDQIVSGAEPDHDGALEQLAAMGIKTLISVDGKAPDAERAAELGMTYVHVPIQYKGITPDEQLRLAKTFRELPGPFYVHCFHGQHRGPAAAALGRLVVDGVPREQAIAEMRQWCGTSGKYEGLYGTIALGDIPSAAETEAYAWDFPSAHHLTGYRQLMIGAARAYDNIEAMADNGWSPPDDHPDIDPINEATILAGLFRQAHEQSSMAERPADFQAWNEEARLASEHLHDVLGSIRRSGGTDWAPGDEAFAAVTTSCKTCHAAYRND